MSEVGWALLAWAVATAMTAVWYARALAATGRRTPGHRRPHRSRHRRPHSCALGRRRHEERRP